MQLERVFGVINEKLLTYVPRSEIDDCIKKAFVQKRQLVIYGSSKQGKTTLLNAHIKPEDKILAQCSPTLNLCSIYKTILKKIGAQIQDDRTDDEDIRRTKFHFKIRVPMLAEGGMEVAKTENKKENLKEILLDIDNAQDVAELLKQYFPDKVIILENFHYLDEKIQQLFAFDLRTFQDIDVRVVILGIWKDQNRLTQYNGDLQDRIVEIPVEPWKKEYLQQIIHLGEKHLNTDMGEVENDILKESFGNVGMLQELCKECCYDAGIIETLVNKRKITQDNLINAIDKITSSHINRYHRSLETFANSQSRQSQDGSPGLAMSYFFVKALLLSFRAENIKNGISINTLKSAIKKIHPHKENMQFDRSVTLFLQRISTYQKNHGINPSIFYYDSNSRQLSTVDPDFYFFMEHYNHDNFLENLKLPLGYE